jgi:hypothetical protein
VPASTSSDSGAGVTERTSRPWARAREHSRSGMARMSSSPQQPALATLGEGRQVRLGQVGVNGRNRANSLPLPGNDPPGPRRFQRPAA